MYFAPQSGDPERRILAVAPEPFYEDRGTPIAVRQLLRAHSEQGYAVDLLTFPIGESVDLPGLTVHRIGSGLPIRQVPIGLSARKLVLDALLIPELARRLGNGGYHHVHAVEEAAFPALVLGRRSGVPVAYDMQSSLPEQLTRHRIFRSRLANRGLRRCERWLIRNVDAVVCSAGLKDYVRSIDPTVRVHEWLYYSGGALEPPPEEVRRLRTALGIHERSRVVVYTGNFEPYQGVSTLLDAAPTVLSQVPDAVFVLVGADPQSARSAARADLLKDGRLKVLPRQPRPSMPAYLAMADLLVSPRAYGGNLPLKIFDYLAAGKPIVATEGAAHRTVLDEDVAVLSGGSPEALGGAIARVLRSPEESERLGAAAREFAKRNLEWDHFAALVSVLVQRAGGLGRVGRHNS